tara:strand:+ start:557 stop:781 length:225 start_codon:yes stop_codon:yes gene_type:complete
LTSKLAIILPEAHDITISEIYHIPLKSIKNSGAINRGTNVKKNQRAPKKGPGENHEPDAFLLKKIEIDMMKNGK